MNNNKINLEFKKTLSGIAGNEFGQEIFDKQVKNFIDYSIKNEINFPPNIKKIAISFIQGFTKEMLDKLGFEEMRKKIKFNVSNEKLENKIWDNID